MSRETELPAEKHGHRLCLLGLLLFTLACLWPVGRLGFIGYDDIDYVYQNPQVQAGLNWDGIVWAFTSATAGNWHPLTWLSLMLDCDLFGLNPNEEHWVNLGVHAANTLLLFVWLRQLTGARWRSWLVAALFAAHPLHVQSVAWISERKDVLSGFFGLWMLLAYTRYCRSRTTGSYAVVLLLFALGLMAKPMLVTLPCVMLLLDFWPLGRAQIINPDPQPQKPRLKKWFSIWQPLLVEKIPLFLLGLASGLVTLWAQRSGKAVVSMQAMAWPERCLHAVLAYALYLGKLFWPVKLAIFYPFPRTQPNALVYCGVILLLVALSLIGLWRRRTQPYLLVGWLWFFVMLLPVIGLIQVGLQAMADRYTYLPAIGLFIIAAWGMAEIAGRSKWWRAGMVGLGSCALLACGVDTRHQLSYWRDNITLFAHVVEVSPENDGLGYFYLGISYGELGNLDAAASNLALAVKASPGFELARSRLGNVLLIQQKYAAAEPYLAEIATAHPNDASARMSLGLALAGRRQYAAAQTEFQAARQLQPEAAAILEILAANTPKAAAELALTNLADELKTNATPEIHIQMALAQTSLGNYSEAVRHCQTALTMAPDTLDALNNLAWLLATCPEAALRDGRKAVQLAEQACNLTHNTKTIFLGTLAAAYAEAGRFDDAIATAQKACANASELGETQLLGRNQELLALYRRHQPWHEPAEKLVPPRPELCCAS